MAQAGHEQQIQSQIGGHSRQQGQQGGAGVSHRAQGGGAQVVKEGGQQAAEDDHQIVRGQPGHVLRGLHQGQQGPQQAIEEEIGQHAHGHAGHQYQNGGISRLPVASSVAQDFLKHSITPF